MKPDRRSSTEGLSGAMKDVRIRLAKDAMHEAVNPMGHHCRALALALEIDDDFVLEHHVKAIVDGTNVISRRNREIRALIAAPAVDAPTRDWEIADEKDATQPSPSRRHNDRVHGPQSDEAAGKRTEDA